jgi:hypothetical protein
MIVMELSEAQKKTALSRPVRARIGKLLRLHHEAICREGTPTRFVRLINARLEAELLRNEFRRRYPDVH